MPNTPRPFQIKLDPWAASSLLQKAIRRGEAELAISAAHELYRHRGKAIWSRLMTIALEDVGIAKPDLLEELAGLAFDANLRAVLGSDIELIEDLCRKLASAPKDRSSDYLYSVATRLPDNRVHWDELSKLSFRQRLEVAADVDQPMEQRAVAALLATTKNGEGQQTLKGSVLREFIAAFEGRCHPFLLNAVSAYASRGGHPFSLMLPILWSELSASEGGTSVHAEEVPQTEFVNGIPLYTFDKHTAVGKKAITTFAEENADMRHLLTEVATHCRREVAFMAAFYADAVPVARRFLWDPVSWRELASKRI